jgi:phosphomannomutase/phosphoglucomutase
MAYFAQFELDCPAVAMVTASHNENGWTGIKMGAERPLTFGPEDMTDLKSIVLEKRYEESVGGCYSYHPEVYKAYINDLSSKYKMAKPLKAVVACGNGTAAIIAPKVLENIGCEVIKMNCDLDYTFPNHNPNPEDMVMLHALSEKVKETGADVGFAFDGDGDRCGVVDNNGQEIFADKVGVLLARHLSKEFDNKQFVVDVKSTGLYQTDPELMESGVKTDYWITGHSYIKRRVSALNALAGFEKSGHFFFNEPIGKGYDDGAISAIMVAKMIDEMAKPLSEIRESLPHNWGSPTMSPYCPDDEKYDVVEAVKNHYQTQQSNNSKVAGQTIKDIITVNGVRVVLEDGTWGLVRASSNKPCLVVVTESMTSEGQMHAMFNDIDGVLSNFDNVGDYDQKLKAA